MTQKFSIDYKCIVQINTSEKIKPLFEEPRLIWRYTSNAYIIHLNNYNKYNFWLYYFFFFVLFSHKSTLYINNNL